MGGCSRGATACSPNVAAKWWKSAAIRVGHDASTRNLPPSHSPSGKMLKCARILRLFVRARLHDVL